MVPENAAHAFPRSAFHGLRWWQFDCSGYLIWMLERLGLAYNVHRISPVLQARRAVGYKGKASRAQTSASGEQVPSSLVD
jgi:stearoyl-CoA desaturase (Delta-9 desaturase)